MPLGFLSISGLTHNQANDGYPIASIPGDRGGPVTDCVLIASGSGLPPLDGAIGIQLFPGTHFSNGTDSFGEISATITLANLAGDDKTWTPSGGGVDITFTKGFWAQLIRGTVSTTNGTRGFDIQFLTLEPGDFTQTLTRAPQTLNHSDDSWDTDEEKGSTDLTFTYDNADNEDPVSFVITRTKTGDSSKFVGTLLWEDGTTDYTYTDYVFEEGEYTYSIQAYKYSPNVTSPASNSTVVTFGGTSPDINITMDLAFSLDWVSTVVLIVEPSGIYTLVEGKTHDTLYTHGSPATVDVEIPRPFAKTAFIGD